MQGQFFSSFFAEKLLLTYCKIELFFVSLWIEMKGVNHRQKQGNCGEIMGYGKHATRNILDCSGGCVDSDRWHLSKESDGVGAQLWQKGLVR